MVARSFTLGESTVAAVVHPVLERLRTELKVPGAFSDAARAEADAAAARPVLPDADATDIPFVTIDPPGAKDLDQALHLQRDGDGYLVRYAIADPVSFVAPGGTLDREVHERGVTYYGPDGRIGLHPDVLAEGAASLLPGQVRPAFVWQIALDAAGEIAGAEVARAGVRSRAQLTYEQVQRWLDGAGGAVRDQNIDDQGIGDQDIDDDAAEMLELLPVIGRLRQEREADRGGASLRIPEQEIVQTDGRYELHYRATLDVEDWNAQISLTTGIAAASLMRRKRLGVLRTLPKADPRDIKRVRRAARGLGIEWGKHEPYGALLRRLDAAVPAHAAFLDEATTLFRGAGYLTFDGALPPVSPHGAIAAEYAHVTAPLRRLVDRYGLEICVAASAGTDVPSWVRDGLSSLPQAMAAAGQKAGAYERECMNLMEALVLAPRLGDRFRGVIVDVAEPRNGEPPPGKGTVVVAEPAVRGSVRGADLPLGEATTVTLATADPATRTIAFTHP